ncbi:MAG: hypothetical protein ACR2JD_00210 [Nocardioides sp.]
MLHGPKATRAEPAAPPGYDAGIHLNVTWLAHDVSVWRSDRLVLDAPGGPWLVTQTPEGTTTAADKMWQALDDDGDRIGPQGAGRAPA